MVPERRFAEPGQLTGVVREVFGADRRIASAERVPGGSHKGVYRLRLDDATRAVVYVWHPDEDYWPDAQAGARTDPADPFSHASGLDQFEGATRRLAELGVRSPRLWLADRSRKLYPADIAVVEDVVGGTLEELLEADPERARPAVGEVADWMRRMHLHPGPRVGNVAFVDAGGHSDTPTSEAAVRTRALREVGEAAGLDPRAAAVADRLTGKLETLVGRVQPRDRIGVIHGEFGADHVLIGADGRPVLIDIEGLTYFDTEWEHVFVRLRFGRHYPLVRNAAAEELDEARMRFYQLAMHVSLVAGPLRIARGDHPERDWFLDLAAYHLEKAAVFEV